MGGGGDDRKAKPVLFNLLPLVVGVCGVMFIGVGVVAVAVVVVVVMVVTEHL